MPNLEWDHTMISTNDDKAIANQLAKKGLTFNAGGNHKRWGTGNYLGYFGLNYIELITVTNTKKAETIKRKDGSAVYDAIQDYFAKRERFNTIALRSDNIEKTHDYLSKEDFPVSDIEEGERLTPQGEVIKWKIFFINSVIENDFPYPFFIQWDGDDRERKRKLQDKGIITPHSGGNLIASEAVFVSKNLEKNVKVWEKLLNRTAIYKNKVYRIKLGEKSLVFKQGDHGHLSALNFIGADKSITGPQLKIKDIIFNFE
ncbi:MAG: VOC family protein [Liquorilactobacillus ghanensis]|uniref:VOC family protein n=1 Tax=Liquorilactobacillus ghanensis TaxID=399370 RepID=UPI0039E78E0C